MCGADRRRQVTGGTMRMPRRCGRGRGRREPCRARCCAGILRSPPGSGSPPCFGHQFPPDRPRSCGCPPQPALRPRDVERCQALPSCGRRSIVGPPGTRTDLPTNKRGRSVPNGPIRPRSAGLRRMCTRMIGRRHARRSCSPPHASIPQAGAVLQPPRASLSRPGQPTTEAGTASRSHGRAFRRPYKDTWLAARLVTGRQMKAFLRFDKGDIHWALRTDTR